MQRPTQNVSLKKPDSPITLNEKWIYFVFIALIGFQIYLNIAAYYALLAGMKNISLFIIGIIMLVFAGMFHIYRHGRSIANNPPLTLQENEKVKALQLKRNPLDEGNGKPKLTTPSSENGTSNNKNNGLLSKVFGGKGKNKNSFEKMWNKE